MADSAEGRRKPRVRKVATVREQVAAAAKSEKQPKRSKNGLVVGSAKVILRPLTPIGHFLQRVLGWLVPRYFINAWRELRQVTWPSRRETWRLTGAVFVFAVVFGALVAGVDKGLDELFKKVILK